jgi:hypothetical protein
MDKALFRQHLEKATDFVMPFSRDYVTDSLPSTCRYLVFPNQSYDGNTLVEDEEIFPRETLPQGEYIGPLDATEVVNQLWRNGKVPDWVNVTVYSYDQECTYLELLCCGRFTASELLYHQREGYLPFHVLGPTLPPGWESIERTGRFSLFWHGRIPRIEL